MLDHDTKASIKFQVLDEDLKKPDAIGDCEVSIHRLLKTGDNEFPLKFNKKLAGTLYWSCGPLEEADQTVILSEWVEDAAIREGFGEAYGAMKATDKAAKAEQDA